MTDAELISAFLAKGGQIQKAPPGHRTVSESDWRVRLSDEDYEQRRIEERHVVLDCAGRERVRNGLGEWIA